MERDRLQQRSLVAESSLQDSSPLLNPEIRLSPNVRQLVKISRSKIQRNLGPLGLRNIKGSFRKYSPMSAMVKIKNTQLINRSGLEAKIAKLPTIMSIKNTASVVPKPQGQKFANIMPKLYDHLKQYQSENPISKSKSAYLIPQLEPSKILDDYKIISHVGKGCFSVVSSAVDRSNNCRCAIKTYARTDQMNEDRLRNIQNEVQNLLNLRHENIIELKHAVRDGRKIQLIMQNGGQQSLSGLLRKSTSFSEGETRKYFLQLVQAVDYCHQRNICHRDIKLENILVDDTGKVKLIDFGFSLKCSNKARLTSYCGTPPYMSPQLAARTTYNGHTSDIWAMGVALYLMFTGKFPFRAGNEKQLYRLIQRGKYKVMEGMPAQLRGLLEGMLNVDESARLSSRQVLESEWVRGQP